MIRIISNLRDGKGLYRDALLLLEVLRDLGKEAEALDYFAPRQRRPAELTICLEVAPVGHLGARNWLVPNPEGWAQPDVLPHFERVLCKTRETEQLFAGAPTVYTGFLSEDHYDPEIPRARTWWHCFGSSNMKGTRTVLEAWRRYHLPPLTLVGQGAALDLVDGVTWHRFLPPPEFRREQNRHLYHLCPSEVEGWGHVAHEALGVGAVLVTTDAPAMAECHAAQHVRARPIGQQHLATRFGVMPEEIRDAVQECMAMTDEELAAEHELARASFAAERAAFVERFRACLEG